MDASGHNQPWHRPSTLRRTRTGHDSERRHDGSQAQRWSGDGDYPLVGCCGTLCASICRWRFRVAKPLARERIFCATPYKMSGWYLDLPNGGVQERPDLGRFRGPLQKPSKTMVSGLQALYFAVLGRSAGLSQARTCTCEHTHFPFIRDGWIAIQGSRT